MAIFRIFDHLLKYSRKYCNTIFPNDNAAILIFLARSPGFVRVSELCNVSLPALKKVRAITGGDNHVEGPEGSDVRHPCDELLPCALAQLQLKAVHALEQLPTGVALELATLPCTDCDVFL